MRRRLVGGAVAFALLLLAPVMLVSGSGGRQATPALHLAAATCSKAGTTSPISLLPAITSIRTNESGDNQSYATSGNWTTLDCGTVSFTIPPLQGVVQNFLLVAEVDAEGFCSGATGTLCEARVLADGVEMLPAASSPSDNTSWFAASSGGSGDANSRGFSRVAVVQCTNALLGCSFDVVVQVKTPSGTTLSLDSTNLRAQLTSGIDILQGFVPITA